MEQITQEQIGEVKQFIQNFTTKHGIIPLLLVESGSRMWKFASEDSDFDVRGFHITSLEQELSISNKIEQLEYLEGEMDVVSYDIDKFFNLLCASNPNLLEQIQSDILYVNEFENVGINYLEFKENVMKLVNLKRLFHHYLSMAHNNFDKFKDEKFTYKKSLYVLRSLYCAKYVIEIKKVPPVIFEELIEKLSIEEDIHKLITEVIEKKKHSTEKTQLVEKEEILLLIQNLFDELESQNIEKNDNSAELRKYLDNVAIEIKKKLLI